MDLNVFGAVRISLEPGVGAEAIIAPHADDDVTGIAPASQPCLAQ